MIEGSFFGQNLDLWISIILTVLVLALGLVIYDIYNHRKLKARYEVFMGINKKRRNRRQHGKAVGGMCGKGGKHRRKIYKGTGNSTGYEQKYEVLLSEGRHSKI